ncbi:MAG: tetratricopeptide repeat protein, partial [Myxococcota bacterium]|nr:tetratricopeptide repeat protein [Myxococcota bacterium]
MALNREKIHQSAQRLAQKGQLDRAIQELGQILVEDPADARTLQRIAELYAKKGTYQEAIQTYVRLAEVLSKAGFYQRAVAVYHQILQLNPTLTEILVALAETLSKLGLPQEATKIYQRAVQLLQKADKADQAARILDKLIAANPDDYQARLQLAEMYLKIGRNDDAIRAFEEALPALRVHGRDDLFKRAAERLLYYRPDNLALCRELAVFHLQRSNIPQAMKLLQYCHKRDPDDIETLRLLATHFVSADLPDKAAVVLQQMARVYAKSGDHAAAAAVEERLRQLRPQEPASRAA